MRISPPATRGGVSVLERVLPPLRRMPVRWRMTLRGTTRNRRRTVLTVVGVIISVCLVISSVINRQYGGIELQDAQVITAPNAAESVATVVRANPRVSAAEPFTRLDVTIEGRDNRYDTLLIALPQATQMHRFTSGKSTVGLPRDGVLLGEGLKDKLGLAGVIGWSSPIHRRESTSTSRSRALSTSRLAQSSTLPRNNFPRSRQRPV